MNDSYFKMNKSIYCVIYTSLAMVAFAGNSLLCRAALAQTTIDAASFTSLRLISGAITLWLIVRLRNEASVKGGNWISATALFAYAAGFSFAYVSLSTATGALLLFGAVQITMIGYGLYNGERLSALQVFGLILACTGLLILLLPGITSPPLAGSFLMLTAGIAWGVYSIRGKVPGDPTVVTAGNFARAAALTILLSLLTINSISLESTGIWLAITSGAVASGVGYAIWYTALPLLDATPAAIVQLSVPVIAAFAGVVFLAEPISGRLWLASFAIIGGIALVIKMKTPQR